MERFPVLLSPKLRALYPLCPESVPAAMLVGCGPRAARNHDQTLAELAGRGGLDPVELVAVLDDVPYPFAAAESDPKGTREAAVTSLLKRVAVWTSRKAVPPAPCRRAWAWACGLCRTANVLPEGETPDRVQCAFCKCVHAAEYRAGDPTDPSTGDDPAARAAGDSTHEHAPAAVRHVPPDPARAEGRPEAA